MNIRKLKTPLHFCGNTSTGKTTAVQLAISTVCCPDFDKDSLALTWASTDNSLIRSISNNFGLSVLLDEAFMAARKDKTRFIYTLTSGKERGRLDKDSKQMESGTWATTILSTGEYSILSMSSQNAGLRMRLIEFENVSWTTSAENSDNIRSIITNNYGHAAPKFAEALINLGEDEVKKNWRISLKYCQDTLLKKTKFTKRIAKKYALIFATARLVINTMNIKLNLKTIANFLYENDVANLADNAADLGTRAYEYLLQELNINIKKFAVEYIGYKEDESYTPQNKYWGKIEDNKPYVKDDFWIHEKYFIIVASKFDEIMKKHHFDSSKVILYDWKTSHRLVFQSDRLISREKLHFNSEKLNTYAINLTETKKVSQ